MITSKFGASIFGFTMFHVILNNYHEIPKFHVGESSNSNWCSWMSSGHVKVAGISLIPWFHSSRPIRCGNILKHRFFPLFSGFDAPHSHLTPSIPMGFPMRLRFWMPWSLEWIMSCGHRTCAIWVRRALRAPLLGRNHPILKISDLKNSPYMSISSNISSNISSYIIIYHHISIHIIIISFSFKDLKWKPSAGVRVLLHIEGISQKTTKDLT